MSAARALCERAPEPARAHAVETVLARAHGSRTRYRVVVELDGARVYTTTGDGPLGRLRAHRRATEWAARRCLALRWAVPLEPRRKATHIVAWERAHLLARLRAEGVLPA